MLDPNAAVGRFALLTVLSNQPMGAFLEWGQPKPLLLPLREQTEPVSEGEEVIVHIHLDKSGRPIASMHLDEYLDRDTSRLHVEQKVELLIFSKTPLAYDAIIDDRYVGILYHNEVFQELEYGARLPGYVKKIRDDGKVDLILQPFGVKGTPDLGRQILERLQREGGFLPLTDKTPAEVIYDLFAVSKKKFKMALGALYKQQRIRLDPDGIRLQKP